MPSSLNCPQKVWEANQVSVPSMSTITTLLEAGPPYLSHISFHQEISSVKGVRYIHVDDVTHPQQLRLSQSSLETHINCTCTVGTCQKGAQCHLE